jgi:hypothetical protein
MQYILKILNKEIGEREKRAEENFERLCYLEDEVRKLNELNQQLRKDLQELSREHFKK